MLTTFMFPLVGILIATRRPGNAIAWILLAIGVVWGVDMATGNYATYAVVDHRGSAGLGRYAAAVDEFQWVPAIGLMGTFLLLLFPDGHLPGRAGGGSRGYRRSTIAVGTPGDPVRPRAR